MRETMKLAVRLMIFTLISGLLLATVNALTEEPIKRQSSQAAMEARLKALPVADEFVLYEDYDSAEYPDIDEVFIALADSKTAGYAFQLSPRGYKNDIVMTLGVNADGSINTLAINSHSETAGLGSRVADEAFLMQFVGVAADPDAITNEIDAISGATVSSKAVLEGTQQAARFARDEFQLVGVGNESIRGTAPSASEETLADRIGAKTAQSLRPYQTVGYPAIEQVYRVALKGGGGYAFETRVKGEKGDIACVVVIADDGLIRSLDVHSEADGSIMTEQYAPQYVNAVAADLLADDFDNSITDAKSDGAKVFDGVRQACGYFEKYLKEGTAP